MCCFYKAFGVASQSGFRESKRAERRPLIPSRFGFFCSDQLPDPERRYQNGHASLSQPQRWPLRARKHGMSPARLEIGMVQTSLLLQWRWGLASPRNHYKNVRSSRHWQPPDAAGVESSISSSSLRPNTTGCFAFSTHQSSITSQHSPCQIVPLIGPCKTHNLFDRTLLALHPSPGGRNPLLPPGSRCLFGCGGLRRGEATATAAPGGCMVADGE
jgi:hypothetical protein